MKFRYLFLIFLIFCSNIVIADRLPNQSPENQVYAIDTVIDATGAIDSGAKMDWVISSPGALHSGYLDSNRVVAVSQVRDTLLTNGGKLSETKNFGFDSKDKIVGLYNIESNKVLTYGSVDGSHMTGEEQYLVDNAGESKQYPNNIRCVFSNNKGILPPFCDIVSTKSSLININSAQISTKGQIRAVAKSDDIPAELNYRIAVTPDTNSGSGYAEGTVKTSYAGSILDGRGDGLTPIWFENPDPGNGLSGEWLSYYAPAATITWKDATEVTGGIKNFQKVFAYNSGFKT